MEVGQRQHDALLLRLPQHLEVPLAKLLRLGRLLLLGVSVQDVILPLERRTGPDEARRESPLLDVLQVANENLAVGSYSRSILFAARLEEEEAAFT